MFYEKLDITKQERELCDAIVGILSSKKSEDEQHETVRGVLDVLENTSLNVAYNVAWRALHMLSGDLWVDLDRP